MASVEAAVVECGRVSGIEGDVPADDVTSLITTCAPLLASLDVAEAFVSAVADLSLLNEANSATFGSAGVIPVILAAMATHALTNADLAASGCQALCHLADDNADNIDAIVLGGGGLAALTSALVSHPANQDVQNKACSALYFLLADASPAALAVMQGARAELGELITSAKGNFPSGGLGTVSFYADDLLAMLTPDAEEE